MTTMQQTRVHLAYPGSSNLVEFFWPLGADLVAITQVCRATGKPIRSSAAYSVEEAHEIFTGLLDGGAY
jgi:hypothetical protein